MKNNVQSITWTVGKPITKLYNGLKNALKYGNMLSFMSYCIVLIKIPFLPKIFSPSTVQKGILKNISILSIQNRILRTFSCK